MKRPRPLYFLRRTLANLRGSPLAAAVTATTIAIVIFLYGAFLLTGDNTYRALAGWASEGDPLVVYSRPGLAAPAAEALARRIESLPEVGRVKLITPDAGLEDLKKALGGDADALEGIDARAILPSVISIGLRDASLDGEIIDLLATRLRNFEGAGSVESETAWLERFRKLSRLLFAIGLGWAAMLGFGALLVVGNSTRLAALTRREEIEVLRLVGASDAFIVTPFFLEGAIQGLAGSVLGLAALAAVFFGIQGSLSGDPFLAPFLGGLHFLGRPMIALLAAAGPLLGAVGAAGSARRFLAGVEL